MLRVTMRIAFADEGEILVSFDYYPELGSLREAIDALLNDYLRVEVLDAIEVDPSSNEAH